MTAYGVHMPTASLIILEVGSRSFSKWRLDGRHRDTRKAQCKVEVMICISGAGNAATLTRLPCALKERINETQLTSQHSRSTDSGKSAQAASLTYPERQLAVAGSHRTPCTVIADRSNGLISLREAQARLTVSWPFAGFVKRLLQRWKVSPSGILPSSFVFPLRFPFTTQGFRTTN